MPTQTNDTMTVFMAHLLEKGFYINMYLQMFQIFTDCTLMD